MKERCFSGDCLSRVWLDACNFLRSVGGTSPNICLRLSPESTENRDVRKVLDQTLATLGHGNFNWIDKVADSVFPGSLYHPTPEDEPGEARRHLYAMQNDRRQFLSRKRSWRPSYFDRMVAWPGKPARNSRAAIIPFNQLEDNVIKGLIRERELNGHNANHMQVSIIPIAEEVADLRIHQPHRDRQWQGTPCLSHLSFSLDNDALVLTALYRNHYYLNKVYGNLLGLRALQRFVAQETASEVGELVCLSAHADLYPEFSTSFGNSMLDRCNQAISIQDNRTGASV